MIALIEKFAFSYILLFFIDSLILPLFCEKSHYYIDNNNNHHHQYNEENNYTYLSILNRLILKPINSFYLFFSFLIF